MTWFIIGLMVPPVNSRTSIILPICYYTKGIMACQLTWISSWLRTGRERITVLVQTSKILFGERLLFRILKAVVQDLESFVSVAKEQFPNFTTEGFKSNEICDAAKQLPERYKKHSKHLPSTQKCHHVTIENKKVSG